MKQMNNMHNFKITKRVKNIDIPKFTNISNLNQSLMVPMAVPVPRSLSLLLSVSLLGMSLLGLGGCAKTHPQDPFESLNRKVYFVNKGLDNLYFKPVAKTYNLLVPPPIRGTVSNFVQNVNEIPTSINDILQGNPGKAGLSIVRFVVNSTFGIFGMFDIANAMGIEPHTETLANTFLSWGFTESSYLVLPILGPSTIRDTVGLVGNLYITPTSYAQPRWRNAYTITYMIHRRAELLVLDDVVESASVVDEYAFVRNAYLQRRASVANGEVEHTLTDVDANDAVSNSENTAADTANSTNTEDSTATGNVVTGNFGNATDPANKTATSVGTAASSSNSMRRGSIGVSAGAINEEPPE